jgi:putative hydrolase of the HAD superfamily
MGKYKSREGTLDWTDIDYWSSELQLNLAGMKEKMNHLIQVHPYVIDFLEFCRQKNKQIHLVTNAHSKTLAIKMAKTEIESHFDQIICSEDIGLPKEEPAFWERLADKTGYRKELSLLADDNEAVLASAATYGIQHLVFVAKSSSMRPVVYSANYPSIIFFKELMEDKN